MGSCRTGIAYAMYASRHVLQGLFSSPHFQRPNGTTLFLLYSKLQLMDQRLWSFQESALAQSGFQIAPYQPYNHSIYAALHLPVVPQIRRETARVLSTNARSNSYHPSCAIRLSIILSVDIILSEPSQKFLPQRECPEIRREIKRHFIMIASFYSNPVFHCHLPYKKAANI